MGVERDTKPRTGRASPPGWPALAVSGIALAAVAAHLIWPHLKLDAVALALIVLAIVPWLGAILESVELPGGWRFQYRQVERAVETLQERVDAKAADIETLAERVEEVERLAILGATTPALEQHLNTWVRSFGTHLRSLHSALDAPLPIVRVVPAFGAASYDVAAREITLDPLLAEDPYFVLRALAHHLLLAPGRLSEPTPGADPEPGAFDVESGLADYLVASQLASARVGTVDVHSRVRELYAVAEGSSHARDLTSQRRFDEIESEEPYQSGGEVWAATFWELRERYGRRVVDRMLVTAWVDRPEFGPQRDSPAFVAHLAAAADVQIGEEVRRLFERRGLRCGERPSAATA